MLHIFYIVILTRIFWRSQKLIFKIALEFRTIFYYKKMYYKKKHFLVFRKQTYNIRFTMFITYKKNTQIYHKTLKYE